MAERTLVVDHLKFSYEGLFSAPELYNLISSLFFEKGWDWYEKMNEEIITSILNVGELYYALLKKNAEAAEIWYEKLKQSAVLINVEIIKKAMKFRFENKSKKFSSIDCVGYVLAKERNLIFLTGDEGFKDMENVEFVKK